MRTVSNTNNEFEKNIGSLGAVGHHYDATWNTNINFHASFLPSFSVPISGRRQLNPRRRLETAKKNMNNSRSSRDEMSLSYSVTLFVVMAALGPYLDGVYCMSPRPGYVSSISETPGGVSIKPKPRNPQHYEMFMGDAVLLMQNGSSCHCHALTKYFLKMKMRSYRLITKFEWI